MWAYTFCVWLHILAAAAWIGAMVFFAAVVVPVVRRLPEPDAARGLIHSLGVRFRVLGWVALGLLVVTGVLNLWFHGISWSALASSDFRATSFGRALTWKLVLVALVIAATAAHEGLTTNRRAASWIGRVTLALSLAVLYFAVALVRGMP